VEHLSFLLNGYIGYTKALMELEAKLEESPGLAASPRKSKVGLEAGRMPEADENDEEDLVPLKVAKSLSLPIARQPHQGVRLSSTETSIQLIKSLMALLLEQDGSRPAVDGQLQDQAGERSAWRGPGPQHMPQVWTLVLKSFTTVSVSKLVEARIVDTLIKAFLRTTEEIQQSTFPQILAISETIAKDKVHQKDAGKLLSNLVFTTLACVTGNPSLEAVGFAVCQGWLDIMVAASISRPHLVDSAAEKVHTRMDAAEVSSLLRKTTKFLRTHLNLGSFEGPTGAQRPLVMRLSLVCDLLLVALNVRLKDSDSVALADLERQVSSSKQLRQEYQASLDDLVTWLFLNARGAAAAGTEWPGQRCEPDAGHRQGQEDHRHAGGLPLETRGHGQGRGRHSGRPQLPGQSGQAAEPKPCQGSQGGHNRCRRPHEPEPPHQRLLHQVCRQLAEV